MRNLLLTGAAMIGLSAGSVLAQSSVSFVSDPPVNPTPMASFSGTVSYDALLSRLSFDVMNTSPIENGGFFTGFLFNVPAGFEVAYIDADPGAGFEAIGPFAVSPFGTFDAGVALGGEFYNGGTADNGLFPTETNTFIFNVTSGAVAAGATVDAAAFLAEAGNDYETPAVLVARFREFDAGADQIVPVLGGGATPIPVPLPMAAWSGLSGLALAFIPMMRRRKVEA